MKLTKNQAEALSAVQYYERMMVGTHTPIILRTHQSLVKKGLLKEENLGNGWRRFILAK